MNYTDEYDGYDDVYGHSVEDDSYISPSDTAQFMYDRGRAQVMSSYFDQHKDIEEEDENTDVAMSSPGQRRDSEDHKNLELSEMDEAKLMSCLDEIRNVLGDSVPEQRIIKTIIEHNFSISESLDALLNSEKEKEIPTSIKKVVEPKSKISIGVPKILPLPAQKFVDSPKVISTAVDSKLPHVIKGFKVDEGNRLNSPLTPRSQSPASGRVTPCKSPTPSQSEERLVSRRQENKVDAAAEYKTERGSVKEHLYVVVIGHVDAGKSTLMGRLLCDLGEVSQRTLHKYEQESKKIGKQSFMYAWVLDETGEERVRGITMDIGRMQFSTKTKQITVLDAPGHADFIPNMIAGAGQADVALLVVDATRGEFESGFDLGGQTREHALLARSLGINQLTVAVNKLDTTSWSEERFNEICGKLKSFLKHAGFKDSDVTYVPCSGLTGENLISAPTEDQLSKWYKGPALIDVIDKFKSPERPVTKPFRMSVNDIFKGTGSGFCVSGRIETGTIHTGDKFIICPTKEAAFAKSVMINEIPHPVAFAGDQVSVNITGVDIQNVSVGYVLSDYANPAPVTSRFEARLVVFNVKVPITNGFPVLLHHQSLIESANIVKLKALINKSNGEIIKKKPRCLGNNSVALVEIEVCRPICMETYKDFKELGRVMLRVAGVTVAAGLVTKIIK